MRSIIILAACTILGVSLSSCGRSESAQNVGQNDQGQPLARPTPINGQSGVEPDPDTRSGIGLNKEQAHFLRGQMHELLGAVQGISEGLAENDSGYVAEAATAVSQGGEHPDGFHEALPDGFRAMSRQTRADFRSIAAMASTGASDGEILARLGETMAVCNSCHSVYRIENRR